MPAFPTARPGTLANIVPANPATQQVAAIKEVARRIDAAATAQSGNAMTVNRKPGITLKGGANVTVLDGGSIVINDAGDLIMLAADGTVVMAAGKDTIPDGTGRTQQSFYLIRDDGTPALVLADLGTTPGHAHQQALAGFDRLANTIIADDTDSGFGLARPHVGGGVQFADTNAANWPATTAATWTSIANAYYEVQNPRVLFIATLQADSGTTGQFRMLCDGVQIDTTQTVTAGFATWQAFSVTIPNQTFGGISLLELQAQRTAGTGTVRAIVQQFSGDQSP